MLLELAIDLLWPTGRSKREAEKSDPDLLRVDLGIPGEFKRRLNGSGWVDGEVVAAGTMTQGRTHSLFALLTGLALIEVARRRRCKALPREIVLAVTADRVVAFGLSPWKIGDGEDVVAVKIKREERGSWPRTAARLVDPVERAFSKGATLELEGLDGFPVVLDDEPSSHELADLLLAR